jgi:hypothetical protein
LSVKRWTVELDGRRHEVVVKHGYFNARRQIFLDERQILDERPGPLRAVRLWNTATEHAFSIAGHACAVRIDPTIDNMTYKKFLIVDGRDSESGRAMTPLPATASGAREGQWLAGQGGIRRFLVSMIGVAVAVAIFELLQRR